MTMLPSGGTVLPNWRPGDVVSASASDMAKGDSTSNGIKRSYVDWMRQEADKGNKDAIQWMANYEATRQSERSARNWTAEREDNTYSRLVQDLKNAGISPYILSSATPMVSNSTGKSYSGTEVATGQHNKNSNESATARSIATALITTLGLVAIRLLLV